MARLVLSVAGAVIGGFFGGPTGARIGWLIGSAVGSYVDPQVIKGPKIGELSAMTARDGVPRPITFGTVRVYGTNVIARGDVDIVKKEERQGKGGPVVETERAYLTFAVRICEGPIGGILRIWEDEKLVYDVRTGSTITKDSKKYKEGFRLYLGDSTQLPGPDLEAIFGVGDTPAYRNTAYLVYIRKDITERKSWPQISVEVSPTAPKEAQTGFWMVADAASERRKIWFSDDALTWAEEKERSTADASAVSDAGWMGQTAFIRRDSSVDRVDELSPEDATVDCTAIASLPATEFNAYQGTSWGWAWGTGTTGDVGFTTRNGGSSFTAFETPVDTRSIRGMVRHRNRWVVALSPDGGASEVWATNKPQPTDAADWFQVGSTYNDCRWLLTDGNRICAGENTEVSVSEDSGATFAVAHTISGAAGNIRCGIYAAGVLYFGTTAGYLIRSTDGGLSWEEIAVLGGGDDIEELYYGGGRLLVALAGELHVSTDSGESFTAATLPYAGSARPQVWYSVDPEYYTADPGSDTLANIVTTLSERVGITSSQIDVSQLTDDVRGFQVAGTYSAGDAIKSLQRCYLFDPYEADKEIVFRKRGQAVVATLTEDDLLEAPERATREPEIEYPAKTHLQYQNADLAYAPTKETAERTSPDVRVVGEVSVEVPVVFEGGEDEAAQIVNIMHKVAWEDLRGERKFKLADNWSWLTPTDCVTLDLRDRTYRIRIEQIETADGVMDITGRHDRISAYSSEATGAVKPTPAPPGSRFPGTATFHFLNMPGLVDAHDKLGYYVIAAGIEDGYSGCRIQRSINGGSTWQDVCDFSPGPILGELTETLGTHSAFSLDTTNTLTVELLRDDLELESVSYEAMLSDANAALIGDEIICFQNATEIEPGVWQLDTLLRGRLATTPVEHGPGERFVLLDSVQFVEVGAALLGVELIHRAVPFGTSPEEAEWYWDTLDPALSQTEFAPVYLELERSGDDLTASWIGRARFGTSINPVHSVNFLGYRVTLTKGANSVTFDQTAETFTYDTSALGSAPVDVSIAGINRITGASPNTLEGSA